MRPARLCNPLDCSCFINVFSCIFLGFFPTDRDEHFTLIYKENHGDFWLTNLFQEYNWRAP